MLYKCHSIWWSGDGTVPVTVNNQPDQGVARERHDFLDSEALLDPERHRELAQVVSAQLGLDLFLQLAEPFLPVRESNLYHQPASRRRRPDDLETLDLFLHRQALPAVGVVQDHQVPQIAADFIVQLVQ